MELSQLAVPSVYVLIFFLGYPSQWLLQHLEPAPLTMNELIFSNIILILIFVTYTQSVFVDPGTIPADWAETQDLHTNSKETTPKTRKWCRKCSAPKPPRAHHCKACKRCIPKMDHHCPWTSNCVSHTTFPHFLRFLLYTSIGLGTLQKFLFTRLSHLWSTRDLPAYLGPSPFKLFHLFATLLANSITLFALGILLIRNIWCLAVNTTTIEGWEIERHRTLLRRARHFGGYLETPDGVAVRIKRQEFPYDIGIFANIAAGMGTANPIQMLNPFARTPSIQSGLSFPTNGFEDEGTTWPPPDPDRSYKRPEVSRNVGAFTYQNSELSREDTVAAFRRRQEDDEVRRRRPFVDRLEESVRSEKEGQDDDEGYEYGDEASDAEEDVQDKKKRYGDGEGEGEEGWRNSEGERLKDFGVDEDVEFYDEQDDDIPLAELIARRRAASNAASALAYA
ncbi:DHHC palmitoyltransferase-domain-containing protein [Paraphoma chrysanthemicola]|uniref:Palmitoyltransferase PFA4 n=1 Tax=Paraphoma chrysanthemicola TaxID=798071 RepID=A0A8K0R7V3_9PLEO|nr:DHHC palmitoyltransferase-domain-containing protein [Paraphoma chrysanthemicola]